VKDSHNLPLILEKRPYRFIMTESTQIEFTPEALGQLQLLRGSILDFKAILEALPETERSPDLNQQFNQFRLETRALLGDSLSEEVPRAITGDVTTDRKISLVVIFGVILALTGLGINTVILEDVLVNSLGCCISSGGMLLVIGGFVVLSLKHAKARISTVADLSQLNDLLLLQIDHRLKMAGVVRERYPTSYPE
jgi:hypothetical protein